MHVCMYVFMFVYMYPCMFVSMYVCMYEVIKYDCTWIFIVLIAMIILYS